MTLDTVGDRSLRDLLEERVEMYGERTFLVFEDREGAVSELTYAEFGERVEAAAAGLAALGLAADDNVVVHLRNSPEFLVAWFALMRLGAVMVPSNIANTATELAHVFEVTGARAAVTEPDYVEAIGAGGGVGLTLIVARGDAGGAVAFDDLPGLGAAAGPAPRAPRGGDDLAQLLFTSGTTSKPKAVMLSHANCLRAGLDSVQSLWLDEGERCLTALPLFHVNGQGLTILAAMTVGGTAIVIEEFRASRFWSQVRRHRATQTAIVAMQLRTLIAQPPAAGERDHALRKVFYAINVSDGDKEEFERRYGVTLINGYGCSEAMTLLAVSPVVGPRRWPSIGLPAPGRTLFLLDEEGREVGPGEVGEIVVEGRPGRSIMLGYYRDAEATAKAIRGNRLHTGDNAYADEEGYLYFFDRKKDMIKRAGENVSASEVEAVVGVHPDVAEVAVVGIPDPIRDEEVAAVVVPRDGRRPSDEEIIAFCAERLSRFKVPTTVAFETRLPKTSIGKVRKDVLREKLS
ncbi:MAG TPA: AMP-binding protein [Solirubrobacterales bacterium]|nr:AMP-binding protein [Solirubrobacterales bacterium]